MAPVALDMDLPPRCLELKQVLGAARCPVQSLSAKEKRAGRKVWLDEDVIVLVRGCFGEDEEDEPVPGTKWMKVDDLKETLDEDDLKLLCRELAKTCKAIHELCKS